MSEIIKKFIRETETGRKDPAQQYETIIGHNENRLDVPITKMTVDQIIEASDGWRKHFGTSSGAAGAYQIIKPTLVQLKKDLNLTGGEKFTAELQERMGDKLLAKRGLAAFLRGDISLQEFGNNVAKEWASMPVLSPVKRGNVTLKRGQSYYDKVAGNSALVSAAAFEAALVAARDAKRPPPPAIPTGTPASDPNYTPPPFPWGWLIILVVLIAVAGAAVFFWRF